MRRLLVLIPLGFALAGCGGSSNGDGGGGASSSSSKVPQTIQISEKEYSINPSAVTVPKAGTYSFAITNDGQITHALNIEQSGGGNEVEAGDIAPGESKTVQYTFAAGGKYEMYCPIDGHKQQGMEGHIQVGGGAGAGTTTSDDSMTTTTSGKGGYGY
jgi:uncharacterized cupredoxin-like copper-binding protein